MNFFGFIKHLQKKLYAIEHMKSLTVTTNKYELFREDTYDDKEEKRKLLDRRSQKRRKRDK